MREKIDYGTKAGVALNLWRRHKNKVYGVILVIVGALGGNVDRVTSLVPSDPRVSTLESQVSEIQQQLHDLDEKVIRLGDMLESHYDEGESMDDFIPTGEKIRLKK